MSVIGKERPISFFSHTSEPGGKFLNKTAVMEQILAMDVVLHRFQNKFLQLTF